jgi:hypothetical protein
VGFGWFRFTGEIARRASFETHDDRKRAFDSICKEENRLSLLQGASRTRLKDSLLIMELQDDSAAFNDRDNLRFEARCLRRSRIGYWRWFQLWASNNWVCFSWGSRKIGSWRCFRRKVSENWSCISWGSRRIGPRRWF